MSEFNFGSINNFISYIFSVSSADAVNMDDIPPTSPAKTSAADYGIDQIEYPALFSVVNRDIAARRDKGDYSDLKFINLRDINFQPPDPQNKDKFNRELWDNYVSYSRSIKVKNKLPPDLSGSILGNIPESQIPADFRGGKFIGTTVRRKDSPADSGINWANVNLEGAYFDGADFDNSVLMNVSFASASNFANTTFRNTILNRATFTGSILGKTKFDSASFNQVNFSGTNLLSTSLKDVTLNGVNFSNANLSGTDFSTIKMENVDFSGANLTSAKLHSKWLANVDLTEANLTGADLYGSNFTQTMAPRANFTNAKLEMTTFKGTDLRSARLVNAKFTGALIDTTDPSRNDQGEEFVVKTDMSDAILNGADFTNSHAYNVVGLDHKKIEVAKTSGMFIKTELDTVLNKILPYVPTGKFMS